MIRTLPPEFVGLANLRKLWLPSNGLKEFPQLLCSMTQLEWL